MNASSAPGALETLESSDPVLTGGTESKKRLSMIRQGDLPETLTFCEDGEGNVSERPTNFRLMCSSVVSWHHGGINE